MTKQFGLMREKEPIRENKGGQDANKGKQSTINYHQGFDVYFKQSERPNGTT